MSDQDVILILSASAGAGHMMAAHAMQQALRAQAPDADIEVLDVLAISNPFFRRVYAGGYLGIVRHMPTAMGWLYDATDEPGRTLHEAIRVGVQNLSKRPTERYLRRRRPSLIVNTHFLPAEFVAQMCRAGDLHCPQVTIITDMETHRLWVQEPTERYYAATELGQAGLATWGVAAECVRVTGIPVRPGFNLELPPAEARRRCRLDPQLPVVLLLGGGFGVGPTAQLLHELVTMPAAAQIAVIAGRNERLKRGLEDQTRDARRPVRVVGFTDRVHEWMRAADLVVTKPGGLTIAESLACGLPLVIVSPIPGQETRNSDYLLEHGAAIKVNHPRLLGHRVGELLADSERLRALREGARAMARPNAAHDIAVDALALLRRPSI